MLARASTNVPPTEKCSPDGGRAHLRLARHHCPDTTAKNFAATSPASRFSGAIYAPQPPAASSQET